MNRGKAPDGRALRIALISNYLPSGSKIGVGYWVDQFARELVRRGHQVVVWTTAPADPEAPYETRTVALTGRLRTFRFAWALRRVDFSGFDVLHAHGDDYWLWRRRAPIHVRTMHGSCLAEALRIRGTAERLRMVALGLSELLSSVVADTTVVVSPATRRWMPWVREVLPPGVDTKRFARPTGLSRSTTPTVLFVGTYGQRKRGSLLATQFLSVVRPVLPEVRLVMVAEDCPTLPSVERVGRIADAELVRLYHEAWVFCLPSSYEGFGIPYLEALAASLPVVATANPGSRFVLDNGVYGVITQPERLGQTLIELLEDPKRLDMLARGGLARAAELSLEKVTDRYEALYRSGDRPA